MKLSGIYRIKNIITSESYVGSSANIERRWKEHQRQLKNNKHCNPKLQNSYNKYGEDAFKYEIFEICPVEYIIEREQERIDTGAFSYNICIVAGGGMANRKHSDETKAKMSAVSKGRVPNNKGKKASDELKAKLSAAHKGCVSNNKGKKASDELKAKLSAAHKGKKTSDEHKAKLSAAAKAHWANLKNKNSLTIEEI